MHSERRLAIRNFICENFVVDNGDFNDDDSLLAKQVMDSTGVLELVSFVEERFGIKLSDEEIVPANLDSVNKLCGFLAKKSQPDLDAPAQT